MKYMREIRARYTKDYPLFLEDSSIVSHGIEFNIEIRLDFNNNAVIIIIASKDIFKKEHVIHYPASYYGLRDSFDIGLMSNIKSFIKNSFKNENTVLSEKLNNALRLDSTNPLKYSGDLLLHLHYVSFTTGKVITLSFLPSEHIILEVDMPDYLYLKIKKSLEELTNAKLINIRTEIYRSLPEL